MDSIFSLVLNTIVLRPYVFVFLLTYFMGCSMHLGAKRAALFCIVGYFIAWLSEYSSIHNGIPYGHYFYIEQTRGRELWFLGVPFMDSISYVFLAYASYSMALVVISPVLLWKGTIYILETKKIRHSLYARILGTILFVYLDLIIDPVALRGYKWFLGQIYGYPEEGIYFGVPVSNFIGWFVVGFLMIYALQKIDRYLTDKGATDYNGHRYIRRYLTGPGLYLGVLSFNLFMTFYIREYTLGWVGIITVLLFSGILYAIIRSRISSENMPAAMEAHLRDFPQAVIPESRQK
jgi:uncharacterized membrane protein